ncbi:MAG: peptidoglycan-binding protein [Phycisphaerales bacterium]|nr:MAG: peptidoglycan-binding protein [Phycisphaerales bacterium]
MRKWTVTKDDDMSSIADATGFFWSTLWDHPDNAALKDKRKNPNVLAPGDEVVIPELRKKTKPAAAEQKHRFRRLGVPAIISIKLMDGGEPRANLDYVFEVEGETIKGKTNADGEVEIKIPPDAKEGVLTLGGQEVHVVSIGGLDPVEETRGVQQRLANLGYDAYPFTGTLDTKTRRALMNFQSDHKLTVSGRPDDATRAKLLELMQ